LQASTQLISSAASQNEVKAEHKHKLLFNSFSEKLLFQQAEALPNRAYVYEVVNNANMYILLV
jgi:hypothetical protein